MRRLFAVCALASGCGQNPAWEMTTGSESSTGAGPGSSSSTGEVTAVPTTGATSEGDGSATDGGTTGIAGTTTGAASTTSGESSSTGPAEASCEAHEVVQVAVAYEKIEDTGVAPMSMVPCPWPGACQELNFGLTHYFSLRAPPGLGKTAGLYRFAIGTIPDWVVAQGRDPANLVGFQFQVVVYEPHNLPELPTTLRIDALNQADVDYLEGTKEQLQAVTGDSSGACKAIIVDQCEPWSGGYVVDTGTMLGTIEVNDETVVAGEYDGNPDTYHAEIMSSVLPIATIYAVSGDGSPTFMISLASERDPALEIGIKFKESPEREPALFAVFCTKWSD
jgi:hypothetical protein